LKTLFFKHLNKSTPKLFKDCQPAGYHMLKRVTAARDPIQEHLDHQVFEGYIWIYQVLCDWHRRVMNTY